MGFGGRQGSGPQGLGLLKIFRTKEVRNAAQHQEDSAVRRQAEVHRVATSTAACVCVDCKWKDNICFFRLSHKRLRATTSLVQHRPSTGLGTM